MWVIRCKAVGDWKMSNRALFVGENFGKIEKSYIYYRGNKSVIEDFLELNKGTIIN
jgi:hypothetical protein